MSNKQTRYEVVYRDREFTSESFIWWERKTIICTVEMLDYLKQLEERGGVGNDDKDIEIISIKEIKKWERIEYVTSKGELHHVEKEIKEGEG